MMNKLRTTAPKMLAEWNKTKKVQTDAAWVHNRTATE